MNKTPMRYAHFRHARGLSNDLPPVHARGFSLVELLVTVAIIILMLAIAVPQMQNARRAYQMRSVLASVTGAIQATRYQAISNGYLYRVALSKTNTNYQVWSNPCGSAAPCWGKIGGAVPLSTASTTPALSQDTTLDFHPSGVVQATTGALTFNVALRGTTETITISNYGNITVTP